MILEWYRYGLAPLDEPFYLDEAVFNDEIFYGDQFERDEEFPLSLSDFL